MDVQWAYEMDSSLVFIEGARKGAKRLQTDELPSQAHHTMYHRVLLFNHNALRLTPFPILRKYMCRSDNIL